MGSMPLRFPEAQQRLSGKTTYAKNEPSLMAGHIKETFILLFTMAGACLIVFMVPGLFVLFPGILCGIASHLIEPG